jgi:branched-chain amino acid transport system permease protein
MMFLERSLAYLSQILLNGAHNGALYALLAYGYVLTFQVTHRPNLAHGAVYAFTGQNLILFTWLGWTALWLIWPLALAFGVLASAGLSVVALWVLARTVFPPLLGKSPNTMVAASLGAAICLAELARLGADTRDFWLPPIFATPVWIGPVSLTSIQLMNLAVISLTLGASESMLRRSRFGRSLRAVSDDPLGARLTGHDDKAITKLAIMAGGAYAILAGTLAAIYFGNIGFGAGLVFGLKVLFLSAAGGFAAPIYGAAGAFALGLGEALWDGYFPIIYRDALIYSALAFLLITRSENQVSVLDRQDTRL